MYKEADVICFDHGNHTDMNALMATPLWQAMPFVRAGRFHRVPAVWFLWRDPLHDAFCPHPE
ncbi:ferrichrome-binding periplasmic protein [Salmonella enterica subsp. arizonae]|uniref:Ferrichrome-binding periplasmic protein n=1 Tax=Salmonella enterica subsp. arizonae TaxID=59203 RepID=A0A379S7E8_SALER|nr:ferrichrome-binding periplasmic protein [Salmonella enterica subsp. arizonae]